MIKKIYHKILVLFYKIPVIAHLLTIRLRYKLSKTYNKDSFILKQNAFEKIYETNFWKNAESKSGEGSELSSTIRIREALPELWKKYNIKTFLDVPCGDFNWMKEVDKTGIEYIGGDIVEAIINRNNNLFKTENISFQKMDITKDILPCVDMIFCKDCLQHLSFENIHKALKNFIASDSKYLLTTSYPLTLKNYDILDGDYHSLNLLKSPFNLPQNYLYKIKEKRKYNMSDLIDKTMYLWEMKDLKNILEVENVRF